MNAYTPDQIKNIKIKKEKINTKLEMIGKDNRCNKCRFLSKQKLRDIK